MWELALKSVAEYFTKHLNAEGSLYICIINGLDWKIRK